MERLRSRAESANRRARTRSRIAPILFVFAFLGGLFFALPLSEFFFLRGAGLEKIAVQGVSALTPNSIVRSLDFEIGHPLDSIQASGVREAIESEPWVESIRSLRLPGGTLVVSVVERVAVARWTMDASPEIVLIDQRGKRFAGRVEPGGALPLVLGKIDEGDILPEPAIAILEELRRHRVLAGNPSELTLHLPALPSDPASDGLVAATAEPPEASGYELQIGEEGPRALLGVRFLEQRIARLATLLESEESSLHNARLIDLRYADRAVLRTEPASG